MTSITCSGLVVPKSTANLVKGGAQIVSTVVVPPPDVESVRIQVVASGVSSLDLCRSGSGQPPSKSTDGGLGRVPFPHTFGICGSGLVELVGCHVEDLHVGDHVIFFGDVMQRCGSCCEYVVAHKDSVVRVATDETTPTISHSVAASLPSSTWTTYVALFDKLRVERGRTIFIDGANFGVGHCATQLAHRSGLFIVASCPAQHTDYVRDLGANVVVDAADPAQTVQTVLRATGGSGVDYFLETMEGERVMSLLNLLRCGGSVCLTTPHLSICSDVLRQRHLSVHCVYLGGMHGHPVIRQQLKDVGVRSLGLFVDGWFRMDVSELRLDSADDTVGRISNAQAGRGNLVVLLR